MANPYQGWALTPAKADVAGWTLTPASVSPPSGPPEVSIPAAMGRAATQGATANFADEVAGLLQATQDGATPWYLKSPIAALAELTSGVPAEQRAAGAAVDQERAASMTPGDLLRRKVQEYAMARDSERRQNAEAKAAHPGAYLGAEIASGIPLGFALPGGNAKGIGKLAAAGATAGGLGGLGGSTADLTQGDVGGALADTALGATIGAGLGAGAGALGKLAGRAAEGIRKATADAGAMASKAAQQALRTARSALGGETTAALQQIAKAEEIAANVGGKYRADQMKKAVEWLASPEVEAIRQAAADNLLELGPGRIAGTLQTARNVFDQAGQGMEQGAIEAAGDALVNSPLKNQVLPRLKNYASRAIPPMVGAAVGGPLGAAAGFGAGAVMGNPGTALANMLKHPATRKLGWELLQRLGRLGGAPITNQAAQAAERALLEENPQNGP